MSSRREFRLATRGSALALRQAAVVKSMLEDRRFSVELVEIETTGDRLRDELIHRLGRTGAFVRSLDEEVLDGTVDGAIHSMKDMPTDSPDELIVAGIPERAAPEDVLVSPTGDQLGELSAEAVVGTSSLRRRAQLLEARSDLVVEPLRGNVDTRVEKLLAPSLQAEHAARVDAEDDEYAESVDEWFNGLHEIERNALERRPETAFDAIVLARAGLERSGLLRHLEYTSLATDRFVPAPGQGAIAVTARRESAASETLHEVVDHPRTRVETTVERVVLAELGGGCIAPIGVHAVIRGEFVHVAAKILSQEGTEVIKATRDLPIEEYVETARAFAGELADQGAADLIATARADDPNRDAARADE